MLLGRPCTAHWCRLSCITTIFTIFSNSPISAGSSISSVSSPRNVTCHSGYEALSHHPSCISNIYLRHGKYSRVVTCLDMSLRNQQITITIDVMPKKRLRKVGRHKQHPINVFTVLRSWIFRQNILNVLIKCCWYAFLLIASQLQCAIEELLVAVTECSPAQSPQHHSRHAIVSTNKMLCPAPRHQHTTNNSYFRNVATYLTQERKDNDVKSNWPLRTRMMKHMNLALDSLRRKESFCNLWK